MTVAENAPQCHTMVGTYLEGIGCSGVPLVVLLLKVAKRALKLWMVFVMDLETGFTFELVNVNGFFGGGGGCRAAERTNGFKEVLPSDVDT